MVDASDLVQVDVPWFVGFNVVLMAFALTFVVHFNCLLLSAYLFKRRTRWWVAWLCLLQAATAMACHTSRLTDFFFATDCSFKPYHNYTMFLISCCTIDLLFVFHIAVDRLVKGSATAAVRVFWLAMGVVPSVAKSVFMVLTIASMQAITGPFGICSFTMNTGFFHLALAVWAIHHSAMLALTLATPLLARLGLLPPADHFRIPSDPLERPLLCLQHVASIGLIIAMFFPNPEFDVSDLVMQSYWAIKSKTVVSLILAYEPSLDGPDPFLTGSSYPSLTTQDSKFGSSVASDEFP